jgi:hypothetical protein
MNVRVKFRLKAHKDTALKNAPRILQKNLSGGLLGLGKRLQTAARAKMRKDTGAEQRSLTYRVRATGLNINLYVYSTLVQAFVDAYGMRRGVFPDFKVNSRLFNWAKRRVRGIPVKRIRTIGTPAGPRAKPYKPRVQKVRRVKRIRQIGTTTNAKQRFVAKNTEARRLAFLVARAIYRRGIAAGGWPKKTLEANKGQIMQDLRNALIRSANEIKRA